MEKPPVSNSIAGESSVIKDRFRSMSVARHLENVHEDGWVNTQEARDNMVELMKADGMNLDDKLSASQIMDYRIRACEAEAERRAGDWSDVEIEDWDGSPGTPGS